MRRSKMLALCAVGLPGHWLALLVAVAWIGRRPLIFVDVLLTERQMKPSVSLIILYFQADCVPYSALQFRFGL